MICPRAYASTEWESSGVFERGLVKNLKYQRLRFQVSVFRCQVLPYIFSRHLKPDTRHLRDKKRRPVGRLFISAMGV
jgi:hypothetical protein